MCVKEASLPHTVRLLVNHTADTVIFDFHCPHATGDTRKLSPKSILFSAPLQRLTNVHDSFFQFPGLPNYKKPAFDWLGRLSFDMTQRSHVPFDAGL